MQAINRGTELLRRPFAVVLAACSVPYVGLILLFLISHRSENLVARPAGVSFAVFCLFGGFLPLWTLVRMFLRAAREPSKFRPMFIAEVYLGVILVFASIYSVVQCEAEAGAFQNAPVLWPHASAGIELEEHLARVHSIFGTMLYLSVVTMTTVGFGDIVPASPLARTLVGLQALFGVSFISIAVGYYYAGYAGRR